MKNMYKKIFYHNLRSSVNSEVESIVSLKVSLISNISLLFIGISNGTLVTPVKNVALYGPET